MEYGKSGKYKYKVLVACHGDESIEGWVYGDSVNDARRKIIHAAMAEGRPVRYIDVKERKKI